MAEYYAIYNIFQKFLMANRNTKEQWKLLEAMMELRAEFAISHAIKGFGMDMEEALELIRSHNDGLTKLEKDKRDILVAALDNLIDFAVAEEFQMVSKLPASYDIENPEEMEDCNEVFERYNLRYAEVENDDINYAMGMAAWWIMHNDNEMLTYMTQGDERVRPWHRALEGLSYPKHAFPAWLIPPIEHSCRCYLLSENDRVIKGASPASLVEAKAEQIPEFVNPVFKESVAKGGKIFSDEHSYFTIPKKYKKRLKSISQKLKEAWRKN